MTKIALIIFTKYGHVGTLAQSIQKGVESTGAECTIFQVPEEFSEEKMKQLHARNKMTEFDGFMFGLSGRFGMMPAQMKIFMDSTASLWKKGTLAGKAAGVFFSTGTQGGGQETIGLTTVTYFAHQGMIFVPLGYVDPSLFNMDEVHGSSPYGSGTFAGPDGSRQPSTLELGVAESHGKHFATIAAKLAS